MALDFPSSPTTGQLFPVSPAPGTPQFRWDGTAWSSVGVTMTGAVRYDTAQVLTSTQQGQARANILGFGSINVQKFTASGTYTPNANMIYCRIEAVGGGCGGQGVAAPGNTTTVSTGAGGGSGGYSALTTTKATIGASQVVTIGAGSAGTASAASPAAGGTTSVGTLCVANGGSINGGGVPGTGDITAAGSTGGSNFLNNNVSSIYSGMASGHGGSSIFGGGAKGVGGYATGNNGSNYGAGGSGGSSDRTNGAATGGSGSAGFVIITEFCTS
jgi:hypothetical protein